MLASMLFYCSYFCFKYVFVACFLNVFLLFVCQCTAQVLYKENKFGFGSKTEKNKIYFEIFF